MARSANFDWDGVRSDKAYNKGYYNMEVTDAEIKHTNNGYKQYLFTCSITEPVEFVGLPYYERITVGTEDDPDADDPKTWATNFGCGRLKGFLEACQIKLKGHPDDLIPDTVGAKFCNKLGQKTQTKGEYAGEIQQTSTFYKLGARDPGLIGEEDAPRRPKAKANGHDTEAEPVRAARGRDEEPERPRRAADVEVEDEPRARRRA